MKGNEFEFKIPNQLNLIAILGISWDARYKLLLTRNEATVIVNNITFNDTILNTVPFNNK